MNILRQLYNVFLKRRNPVKWARKIGVVVGDNTMIAPSVVFSSEPYLIQIGSNVQITNNVFIHTHGGGNCIRKQHPDFDCFGKVIIDDWVYVGAFSQIMPGCTIGEGSLIAAGSIVTKSVAPHSVMAGNPARFICTTEEYYERNKKYDVKTKGMSSDSKRDFLLNLPQGKFIRK